jgi:hypothetical protein
MANHSEIPLVLVREARAASPGSWLEDETRVDSRSCTELGNQPEIKRIRLFGAKWSLVGSWSLRINLL